jgi:hypothetical protein
LRSPKGNRAEILSKQRRKLIQQQLAYRVALDPIEIESHVGFGLLGFVHSATIGAHGPEPRFERALGQEK